MPKLTDMFSSLLKLDANKEYDFTVTEKTDPNSPPPVVPPAPPVDTPPPTPPEPQMKKNSTVEQKADDIAALQAQVQSLQAANLALLNRLPVQQEEKSVEEMIRDLCVSTKQERSTAYGIHQTRTGTSDRSQSDLSYR